MKDSELKYYKQEYLDTIRTELEENPRELLEKIGYWQEVYFAAFAFAEYHGDEELLCEFDKKTKPIFESFSHEDKLIAISEISWFYIYYKKELTYEEKFYCNKINPQIFLYFVKNPPLELQKEMLETFWMRGMVHEKYDNDEFLKSEWVRKMKLKNGGLDNNIPIVAYFPDMDELGEY